MNPDVIPFSRSWLGGQEQRYINEVLTSGQVGAGGQFTQLCEQWLEQYTGSHRVLLTASCTNALELSAMLIGINPGDEVIVPSFTFTSTANAFALRGAKIVFVDIRPDTLNIDEQAIAAAITPQTRAIVPVHYAGTSCDMDSIMNIARRHGLYVIEDAAQGLGASYSQRPLGTSGHLGCYSFHASKNISCGEGGALLINDQSLIERAQILHDKGTTRAQFRAGRVRQYDWVDYGMSAPPSELQAGYLLAQLEHEKYITEQRLHLWELYQKALAPLVAAGQLQQLRPPIECAHNAHIFAVLFNSHEARNNAQQHLAGAGIQTALHYQPLHRSIAGRELGRPHGNMENSESLPDRLLRLPLWPGMPSDTIPRTAEALHQMLKNS